jgi:hypothetical protein
VKKPEGVSRVGKIRFVHRPKPDGLDFYRVIRVKTGALEVTFDSFITERVQQEV